MSTDTQDDYLTRPIADVRRTSREASASAAELKQFISSLRGKSPQEMLGSIAQSSLVQATVQSAVGCAILMAVLTIGPYLFRSETASSSPTKTNGKPVSGSAPAAAQSVEAVPAVQSTATSAATSGVDVEKAAKALGIDEVKPADPKSNPREKDLDKLLDGVD